MTTDSDPIIGNWYHHLDKGQNFRVVALDADSATAEIQYFDGGVEAIDLEQWYELNIEPAEAPENWAGPVDVAETEDLGSSITDTGPEDWNAPAREYRETDTGETPDDWGDGYPEEEPLSGSEESPGRP